MAGTAVRMSDVVRQIFSENGNRGMRLPRLWELAGTRAPASAAMSKNHFKRHVIKQLLDRRDLVKVSVLEEVKGKGLRQFYGLRFKNNTTNVRRIEDAAAKVGPAVPAA